MKINVTLSLPDPIIQAAQRDADQAGIPLSKLLAQWIEEQLCEEHKPKEEA